ncbi:MAG: hypothetical protein RsTaC01_0259 [Candidatus Paraimprobicoccus trichonymphae]|uniref:Uncharacterized protein n=1 Tax=Candidatus Paraimprobicoccus trichonymphae TaxID=3033793 RepID=A0AA48I9D0_9FIRM|nr:MAG: hypothetical protein RsTaC01_0259 [Candidatus Paraimprobicoccus trichonymphae]
MNINDKYLESIGKDRNSKELFYKMKLKELDINEMEKIVGGGYLGTTMKVIGTLAVVAVGSIYLHDSYLRYKQITKRGSVVEGVTNVFGELANGIDEIANAKLTKKFNKLNAPSGCIFFNGSSIDWGAKNIFIPLENFF